MEGLRHADACVLHGECKTDQAIFHMCLAHAVGDAATLRGIFQSVAQKIELNLLQAQLVHEHYVILHIRADRKMNLLFVHLQLEKIASFGKMLLQAAGLLVQNCSAALDTRHIQHIVDEAQQVLPCAVQLVQTV